MKSVSMPLKRLVEHSYNWHIHIKEGKVLFKQGGTEQVLVRVLATPTKYWDQD